VELENGESQWTSLSDVNAKHRFRDLAPEDILSRVARMPVAEWSYKTQDAAIRHIGPTAQDFHAAFGLGQNPLRIGTLDASGVALAGVRALEARTRSQSERIDALERALSEALAALCTLSGECP
jgi:glutathione S-transferase